LRNPIRVVSRMFKKWKLTKTFYLNITSKKYKKF
jgi:hypothetical protein